jgi:hypothetical protein
LKSNNKSRLFESLDFLYVPAPDIEASISYYTNVLGSELLWKIHAFGVWVACVRVSNSEPLLLLADHIKKNDLIMIYRVSSLDSTASTLRSQGWKEEKMLEIPPGPCYTFRDPAGNAIAIYENLRPEVMEQFNGRIDKL